jgi:mRNA interferase HigB
VAQESRGSTATSERHEEKSDRVGWRQHQHKSKQKPDTNPSLIIAVVALFGAASTNHEHGFPNRITAIPNLRAAERKFRPVYIFAICEVELEQLSCSQNGNTVSCVVRVISVKTLKSFWEKHPDAESPLRAWYTEARRANWRGPQDIKTAYRTASILRNNRVVFNVKGNTYRLVVAVKYEFQVIYIRFIGTHAEYDKIKAEEV